MRRLLAYFWFTFVMCSTAILSDVRPMLRLRGWLVRPCFKSCGKRFEIASGVRINFTIRLSIGDDVYIAPGCWIHASGGIRLDDEVMLGPYTALSTGDHARVNRSYRFGHGKSGPIHIGRGSWTASHVVILKGVTIGQGVLVAAGAVVNKDVPDDAIVGGIPARVLRSLAEADEPATVNPESAPATSA